MSDDGTQTRHFPARGGPLLSVTVTLTADGAGRKRRYRVHADPPDRTCAPIDETCASRDRAQRRFDEIVRSLERRWQRTPRWEDG